LHDVRVSAHQHSAVPAAQAADRSTPLARLARLLEENGTLVVVVAAFASTLITHLRVALTVDSWMALVSGREVAQHGLPSHDALTVWAHGHRWIDQQWLAQLVFYELHRLGGVRLVTLTHAALVTGALALAAVLARRAGGSARSATWVSLPVLVAFWRSAAPMRPQSFAYLLFVVVLWLLLDDLRTPSRRVYLALPVLALWANLHGSVVVGSALVSGYAALEIVPSLRSRPRRVRPRSLVLLAAPWLCVLASPYATSLPHYYREIFSSGFGSYVTEWAPTTLTWVSVPFYLLAFGGIWLVARTGDKTSSFEKLAFVGLVVLGLDAERNSVWLALLALIVLPKLVDALRAPALEPARLNRLLALAMIAGVIVATAGVATEKTSWFTADFPAATGDAAAAAAGPNGRIFADERYADWLIWSHPDLAGRIAYDSRFELLSRKQLRAVSSFRSLVDGWASTVRGYTVLVLDRQADGKARAALLKRHAVRTIARSGDLVVLRTTG
jgi:hypothetical protein